jgi:hypothetical protein
MSRDERRHLIEMAIFLGLLVVAGLETAVVVMLLQ